MKRRRTSGTAAAAAVALLIVGASGAGAAGQETPAQAGEEVGYQGEFVRLARNAEGWVVVGYRIANESVGQEWMLLDVGMTVLPGAKDQQITRDKVKLVSPQGQVVPLPSQEEFSKARASLEAMTERADMMRDSINYFPPGVDRPCRIGFFGDPTKPMQGMAYDQVELSSERACIGRLYFHVPDGIQYGNYNLDVEFADSVVRVPMQIMTKEEAKVFEKEWKEAQEKAKHKPHEH